MTAVPYTCTPSLDTINSLSIPSFVSSISLPATSHFQSSSSHYHPSISSSHAGARLSSYCYPSNKLKPSPYNKYGKVNEPSVAPIPISEVCNDDDQQKTNESNELSEEESIECVDKEKQLQNLVENIRSQIPSSTPPTPPSSAAIFESMQSKNRAMLSMIGPANAIRQQEERCMSDVATQIQTFLNRYKVESKMYSIRAAASVQKDRDVISVHPSSNAGHADAKNELEQKFRRSIRSTKVAETKSDEKTRSTESASIPPSSAQQRSADSVTLGSVTSAPLWARRQSSKGDAPIDAVNQSSATVFDAFPTSLSSINSLASSPLAFPTTNTH